MNKTFELDGFGFKDQNGHPLMRKNKLPVVFFGAPEAAVKFADKHSSDQKKFEPVPTSVIIRFKKKTSGEKWVDGLRLDEFK